MSALLQPGFLFLFAVVGFVVFLAIGAKEDYKNQVLPLTRRIMLGIIVAIATFGVFTVLQHRNGTSFQSGTEATRVTAR
jgi:membrane-bound acyltransferase YfiQ involved in biofilm formation